MNSPYKEMIKVEVQGIFGSRTGEEKDEVLAASNPILRAFIDDYDIQYMQIISTSFGDIRTFTKQYKQE